MGTILPRKIQAALRNRKLPKFRHATYKAIRTIVPIQKNTFFFQSYLGRAVSCSPRAISEYIAINLPGAKIIWSVNKPKKYSWAPGIKVVPGSFAHYWHIATAKYIISNTGLADGFEKRSNQIHLQTWHGSTLKRIGRDKGLDDSQRKIREAPKNSKKLSGFAKRVSMWDYLIAANSLSAHAYKTAWIFGGEMLHLGYPRNDSLLDEKWTANQRRDIREKLSIPQNNIVALWAPTWRDDAPTVNGRLQYEIPIDLKQLAATSNVTVLAKMHYKVANLIDDKDLQPKLINVSEWDDINDLFPASDLLISDFSATIPDYALTGKPIVFFIPDYDEYMSTRGTYIEIPTEGPGPLVRTSEELLATISDLSWSKEYTERYKKFAAIFGEYDDGHATERIVKRLLSDVPIKHGQDTFISQMSKFDSMQ